MAYFVLCIDNYKICCLWVSRSAAGRKLRYALFVPVSLVARAQELGWLLFDGRQVTGDYYKGTRERLDESGLVAARGGRLVRETALSESDFADDV